MIIDLACLQLTDRTDRATYTLLTHMTTGVWKCQWENVLRQVPKLPNSNAFRAYNNETN